MFRKLLYKKMFLNEDVEAILQHLSDPATLKRIFEGLNPMHYKTLYNALMLQLPREKAMVLHEHKVDVLERQRFDFFWEPYMQAPNKIPEIAAAKNEIKTTPEPEHEPEPKPMIEPIVKKEDFKDLGKEIRSHFFPENK
jgi:hypothetical protein